MADIVLSTINARYIHASLGLRSLRANLGALRERSTIIEFEPSSGTNDMAERIFACEPKIVGFGVYIWNTVSVLSLVRLLKQLQPELIVILGGPEISHEIEGQSLFALADVIIPGEADVAFRDVCLRLLSGEHLPSKVVRAPLPDLAQLELPYGELRDDDVAHRVVYVEAARGCPFSCEFCLSSLDEVVRAFPLERLREALDTLLERGARQFKFVDRTFNLDIESAQAILSFFLERLRPGLFLHFEMVPDRLPESLRQLIARFPAGTLQFEIGIQTFDASVARNVSRRQNFEKTEANFAFLREHTGVHLHADLMAGLPGETWETFAAGFDRLWALRPHEIQVEMLKRLKGTPITRHMGPEQMLFAHEAPYEVIRTRTMSFGELARLRRFSRTVDRFANSGRFPATLPLLLRTRPSAFACFEDFSQWLFARHAAGHGLSLSRQFRFLGEYLLTFTQFADGEIAHCLQSDYAGGRSDRPDWLFGTPKTAQTQPKHVGHSNGTERQKRHASARSPDPQALKPAE